MKTIELLDKALCDGSADRIFIVTPKEAGIVPFKQWVGAVNANGKYSREDAVPCGVFVYFDEDGERPANTEIPDAIFEDNEGCKIGFWDYVS
jgi:hypothetical protein